MNFQVGQLVQLCELRLGPLLRSGGQDPMASPLLPPVMMELPSPWGAPLHPSMPVSADTHAPARTPTTCLPLTGTLALLKWVCLELTSGTYHHLTCNLENCKRRNIF